MAKGDDDFQFRVRPPKGFITDGESIPVALFNHERRHSWERAIQRRCSPSAQVGQNGVIEEERTFGSS